MSRAAASRLLVRDVGGVERFVTALPVLLAFLVAASCTGTGHREERAVAASVNGTRARAVTISVHPACADVWRDVFKDADPSLSGALQDTRPEDQTVPTPALVDRFLSKLHGLEQALAPMGRLDRDLFYMRVYVSRLEKLILLYPRIDPPLLRAAKIQACKDVIGDDGGNSN